MTGAQAAAAALCCEGVRCVFGIPGAQNNEFWDALKARRVPYLLVTNESSASVMADASARVTGEVGVFSVVPGPGPDQRHDRHRRGAARQRADRRHRHRRRPRARTPRSARSTRCPTPRSLRPIVKAVIEVRHQAEIPGAIHQAFRDRPVGRARPGRRRHPVPLLQRGLGLRPAPSRPPTPSRSTRRPTARRSACLADRRTPGRDLRGDGLRRRRPVAGRRRRAAPGPGGHLGQRQGVHPRRAPAGRRLGLRQAGDPRGREGVQGRRPRPGRRRQVQRGLDGQLRDPEARHASSTSTPTRTTSAGTSTPASSSAPTPGVFLDRLLADADAIRRPPCPALWKTDQGATARSTAARTRGSRITAGVDPMVFLTQLRCVARARRS